MREIKFRAWDFVNKIMDEDIFIDGAGNAYDYASTTYNTPNTEIQRCEFPVMQYTGLKDRNGVEIYEGDILEMAEQSLLRFEVVYDAGHMAFMRNWIDKRVPATRCKGEMEHLSANTDFLEVIGNGYENPELLKDGIQKAAT